MIVTSDGAPWQQPGVLNALVKALARAFRWRKMLDTGVHATLKDLARAKGVALSYVSRAPRLTLLAPETVEGDPRRAAADAAAVGRSGRSEARRRRAPNGLRLRVGRVQDRLLEELGSFLASPACRRTPTNRPALNHLLRNESLQPPRSACGRPVGSRRVLRARQRECRRWPNASALGRTRMAC